MTSSKNLYIHLKDVKHPSPNQKHFTKMLTIGYNVLMIMYPKDENE